jgi:Uma2 family endonuclease
MIATLEKVLLTPEDLLAMPDGDQYELVNGRLVERHVGLRAGLTTAQVVRLLGNYCAEHPLGYVFPGSDSGFLGFPDSPRTVRKPDVSFVRYGRFENEEVPAGYAKLAPDLAVEVISPGDLFEDVGEKVEEYVRAGVRLVWVLSPKNKTVHGYRADGSCFIVREAGELDGEDVVPGFRCKVHDLFPTPPIVSPSAPANGEPAGS